MVLDASGLGRFQRRRPITALLLVSGEVAGVRFLGETALTLP